MPAYQSTQQSRPRHDEPVHFLWNTTNRHYFQTSKMNAFCLQDNFNLILASCH
jgi:hypothetical protein